MGPTKLMEPVELTEAELRAVAGGATRRTAPTPGSQSGPPPGSTIVLVGILQHTSQSSSITQQGGSVRIG
jgi:hypothetical protein